MLPGMFIGPGMATVLTEIDSITEFSHTGTNYNDTLAGTTHTVSVPIGTADADRIVLVFLGSLADDATVNAYATVTIGGVSATIIGSQSSGGVSLNPFCGWAYASVPTGTNADVVSTYNSGHAHYLGVSAYRIISSTNSLVIADSLLDTCAANETVLLDANSLTTVVDGFVVAGTFVHNGLSSTGASGMTEDSDFDVISGEFHASYSLYPSTGANQAVDITNADTVLPVNENVGSALSIGAV